MRWSERMPFVLAFNAPFGGSKYSVKVQGSIAPDSVANASSPPFPTNMLAQMVVTVKKVGDTDSLKAATILWVN